MNCLVRIPMLTCYNSTRFKCSLLHQYFIPFAGSIQQKNVTSQKVWQSSLSHRCLKPLCCTCVTLHDVKSTRIKAVSSHIFYVQKLINQPDVLPRRHFHVSSYFHGGASEISRQSSTNSEADGKVSLERLTKVQELMTLQVKCSS